MKNALLALGLTVLLGACGGGGDAQAPTVIASNSRTVSLQTGPIDAGPFVYEVLTVSAPTSAGVPIDLSTRLDVVLSDGFAAWVQFTEDGEAVDGFARQVGNGEATANLRHTPAKGGTHTYAVRVVVQGIGALHGSAQFINPSLTITE